MTKSSVFEDITRFVDAELSCRKHPGSSVSIIRDREIVWSKGFGYANVEEKIPATAETVYRCASITKPVITVGFLQLLEKNLFSLDDEVNSHLDNKIRDIQGDEPTIRDLLTHRSGMPTRVPPLYLLEETPLSLRGYIESAARAVRPRGEAWAYCNTAYAIVGYLIELFTGKTYDEYVTKNVLQPMEMNSSVFTYTPQIRDKLAQGYKRDGGTDKPLIIVPPYLLGTLPEDPAGSLYSSILDLGNFLIMNLNRGCFKGTRILKEETVKEMHRLQAPSGNSKSGMGLTWFHSIHDGHIMLGHTGGLPDYANNVCFYPEEDVGVCWLSNLQDGSGWRPPAPTVLRMVQGDKPCFSSGFQTVPDNWDKLCGVYGDETHNVTLTVQNGYLILDNTMTLEKKSEAHYIAHGSTNDGYEVYFELNAEGLAKSISFGTMCLPRYTPTEPVINQSLELKGMWKGEYWNSTGFHILELTIKDESHGTIKDPQGETLNITDFKATKGKITGSFRYKLPEEYAKWGTSDYSDVSLELTAIDREIHGVIRSRGATNRITLTKSP